MESNQTVGGAADIAKAMEFLTLDHDYQKIGGQQAMMALFNNSKFIHIFAHKIHIVTYLTSYRPYLIQRQDQKD